MNVKDAVAERRACRSLERTEITDAIVRDLVDSARLVRKRPDEVAFVDGYRG